MDFPVFSSLKNGTEYFCIGESTSFTARIAIHLRSARHPPTIEPLILFARVAARRVS